MNNIDNWNNVFIVGIKGAAMANIALILQKMGKQVVGSDTAEEFITDQQLVKHHIEVIHSFERSAVPSEVDVVIYSAAHGGVRNPQIEEAQKRNIPIIHQAEFLGELIKKFEKSVAVCGTHGKTTTSAMLAYCLIKLRARPSYLVGTSSFNEFYGGDYDADQYFVVEADEYGLNPPTDVTPKLQFLHPTHCIATNIDFDHPDVYSDIQATKDMFYSFFQNIIKSSASNKLYLCIDDADLALVAEKLPRVSYETFGFDSKADLQIINPHISEDSTSFELVYKSKNLGVFSLSLFGGKHTSNAAGVVLALINLGFSSDDIRKVIGGFTGAKRRFELVKKVKGMYLFDDYAHHPEEIRATLETAKERFKHKRIIVVFQPHTFSRTISLKDQFVDALSIADLVYLAPIFASAREKTDGATISSSSLVEIARSKSFENFYSFNTKKDLVEKLSAVIQKKDVVFTMGAGDVYKLKNDIIGAMESGAEVS